MSQQVHNARTACALVFAAALLSIPRTANAQGRWDAYKPGTIAAIIDAHDSTLPRNDTASKQSVMVSGDDFPTLTRVIYRGQSRPLDPNRATVMREWSMTFLRDTTMLNDFHREYLFQEGKRLLWLPVQDTVASFFPKELKSGQPATLYVIFLGAQWLTKDITWAFAVNEFRAEPIKP